MRWEERRGCGCGGSAAAATPCAQEALASFILHLKYYILHLTPYILHLTPYILHLTSSILRLGIVRAYGMR